MNMNVRQKLDDAFRSIDQETRQARIERVVWLGQHDHLPGMIMGRTETLHLLREARDVFVNGHYAAALLLGVAVIEHSLVEELQLRGAINGSPPLAAVLTEAERHEVLPSESFPPIRQLVSRRNPFAHLKAPDHEHGLGSRVMSEKRHPQTLLKQDAEEAMKAMYEVFRATLRYA
jgi:hypothetical protein